MLIKTFWIRKSSQINRLCNIWVLSMICLFCLGNSVKRLSHRSFIEIKDSKFLMFFDKAALESCIVITKSLKGSLWTVFSSWPKFSFESHSHDARRVILGYLKISSYWTKTKGKYLIIQNAIYVWNQLQSWHQNFIFYQLRGNTLKY